MKRLLFFMLTMMGCAKKELTPQETFMYVYSADQKSVSVSMFNGYDVYNGTLKRVKKVEAK